MLCIMRWTSDDRSSASVAAKEAVPEYGDNTGGIRWPTPCELREGDVQVEISTGTKASIVLDDAECAQRVTVSPSFPSPGTTVSFRGAYSDAVRCVRKFSYFSDEDFTCADEVTITANDLGSRGAGTARSVTEYVNVEMTLVNDPPTIAFAQGGSATCEEDSGANHIFGFVVSDSDADSYPVEVYLDLDASCNGAFTLTNIDALRFMGGSHASSVKTTQFRAPLLETNAALKNVTFTPGKDLEIPVRVSLGHGMR